MGPVSEKSIQLQERYRTGEWRARLFHDAVLSDIIEHPRCTAVDIGCGNGIEGSTELSRSLADHCRTCIGIEPDTEVAPPPIYSAVHRCVLEEAPLRSESVDVAFSYMVLEHLQDPRVFFDRIFSILRPGGVFWTVTVDSRHWFASVSRLTERLRIKPAYLKLVLGERGQDRYLNYPVHYRVNRPSDFDSVAAEFASRSYINLYRPNEVDYYFPSGLKRASSALNAAMHALGMPGSLLMVRLEKAGA